MNFTDEQQLAIEKKGKVIVSASAGSGKTAVMIERLVSLILAGTDVRQVLALTFTNKAAAQMRDRLRTALSKRLMTAAGEEKARLKDQLDALPVAEIGTIHAFCGRLVRTNFYLAETDAAFRIISPDDADGSALQGRAADLVFEQLFEEKNEDFFGLLSVYFRKKKDRQLRQIVKDLYGALRGLGNYREILSAPQEMFGEACAYLAHNYQKTAEIIIERMESLRGYFLTNQKATDTLNDIVAAAQALLGKGLFEMREIALPPLKISRNPPKTKASGAELRNLLILAGASEKIKDLYAELREISDEETEKNRAAQAAERTRALSMLLLRFDDEYARLKREANVLDYNDLEHLSLKVLESEEARESLRGRYTHIFVDEYQDVNRVQERILSLLAGEEVFLVGDSKQAIYGFRGSNSAFFEEKRRTFRELGGDIPLNRNFRSGTAVLDAVNRVFSSFLKNYEPMAGGDRYNGAAGETRFHLVEGTEETEEAEKVYSVMEHVGVPKTDEIATYVANLIEEEIASEFYDADLGAWRKTEFSDIAVLTRKHSGEMEAVVRELEKRDIPVSSSSSVNLCEFFEAQLLIDWLSLLDNAEQDAPLCTALLSAVVGLNEDDLAAVRLACPHVYAFRDACRVYAYAEERREDPLAQKLRNFFTYLKDFRIRAQVMTAADVMSSLLSMGLETQIAAGKNGAVRLARVRRLLAEGEDKSVHRFLSDLKARDYEIEFTDGGGEGTVQVMTMHASKGLEFPVVIVTDLDVSFRGKNKKHQVLFTEKFGLAPHAYDLENRRYFRTVVRRASEALDEAEQLVGETNLLYVAMTRAKFRLHMIFQGKDAAISPSFAGRLSDFIDLFALHDLFVSAPAPQEEPLPRIVAGGEEDHALAEALRAVYRRPYPYEDSTALPLKSSATEIMRESREEHSKGGGGPVHTKEEGLAYHAFLQHAEFGRTAGEELDRMRREEVLTPAELALLDEEKLQKILSLPCFDGIESKRLWREQTFLVLLPACEVYPTAAGDEILFQGAIDLLVEDGEGFTVIDYKFSGRGDDHIKETYAPQIKLYRKAVSKVMGVREETVRARIVNIALLREIEM